MNSAGNIRSTRPSEPKANYGLRPAWLVIILALVSFPCPGNAETPLDRGAKARAALYQAEICSVLTSEHWRVTTNSAGRIVAARLLGQSQPGFDPLGYMCLTLTLRPRSATNTECGANVVGYVYGYQKGEVFQKKYGPPVPLNSPENVRDIDAMLARARQRMYAAHPEYAPSPAH